MQELGSRAKTPSTALATYQSIIHNSTPVPLRVTASHAAAVSLASLGLTFRTAASSGSLPQRSHEAFFGKPRHGPSRFEASSRARCLALSTPGHVPLGIRLEYQEQSEVPFWTFERAL